MKRTEKERKMKKRKQKIVKRQWYVTIITGICFSDKTSHATLPSFSTVAFASYINYNTLLPLH